MGEEHGRLGLKRATMHFGLTSRRGQRNHNVAKHSSVESGALSFANRERQDVRGLVFAAIVSIEGVNHGVVA